MAAAGLSIAFNAKPIVVDAADLSISEPSLRSVIDLIQLQ
jgi:phosphoserine phosphatase